MAGCLLKLKEYLDDLKPSERKVANFILNYSDTVMGMSINELAERSCTSKAAVVRLCKTLNFNGYREFMLDLTTALANQKTEENNYTDIKAGDDLEIIIKNVSLNNKKSIDDTLLVLDYHEVKKAIAAIDKAKRVDFYGVGASGIIAMDAQQKFMRINKFSMAYTDPHLQVTAAANLSKGNVAVAISYTGETRDVIESLKVAKHAGATTIAITKYAKSTLSEFADIKLFISSPETTIRSGAMGSRIAQLNIVDIIYSGVASIEYPEIKKYLDATYKFTALKKNHK